MVCLMDWQSSATRSLVVCCTASGIYTQKLQLRVFSPSLLPPSCFWPFSFKAQQSDSPCLAHIQVAAKQTTSLKVP